MGTPQTSIGTLGKALKRLSLCLSASVGQKLIDERWARADIKITERWARVDTKIKERERKLAQIFALKMKPFSLHLDTDKKRLNYQNLETL